MSRKNSFNTRGFVSLLTAGGFTVMTATGVLLYIVPPGRVANWVDWSIMGLAKEEWGAIHMTSSILFIGAGLYHLVLNWKPFMNYLASKIRGGNGKRKMRSEGWVAAAATAVVVAGTLGNLPPFTYVIELNDYFKNGWSVGLGSEPPFGHAEEVSIKSLANKTHFDAKVGLKALQDAGLTAAATDATLRDVADANNLSPAAVYAVIREGVKKATPAVKTATLTPDKIEELYAGTGVGRKTVSQVADDFGLDPKTALTRLAEVGFAAGPDDRMKDVAGAKYEPMALLAAILIEGHVPVAGQ